MPVSTEWPDGTSYKLWCGQDDQIIIETKGSFSPRRAREIAEMIELEAKLLERRLARKSAV
jgi:hypothetical protein